MRGDLRYRLACNSCGLTLEADRPDPRPCPQRWDAEEVPPLVRRTRPDTTDDDEEELLVCAGTLLPAATRV